MGPNDTQSIQTALMIWLMQGPLRLDREHIQVQRVAYDRSVRVTIKTPHGTLRAGCEDGYHRQLPERLREAWDALPYNVERRQKKKAEKLRKLLETHKTYRKIRKI